MSKFFSGGVSDSDYSSSDEEDLYGVNAARPSSSSEESELGSDSGSESDSSSGSSSSTEERPKHQYMRNQFLKGQGSSSSSDESDSDEEGKKIVKSAKAKLLDEIDAAAKNFDQLLKSHDWVQISSSFDKLLKNVERAQKLYENLPASFLRILMDLKEGCVRDASSEDVNLTPSHVKSLNAIKQKVKKTERSYEAFLAIYREDPSKYEPNLSAEASLTTGKNARAEAIFSESGSVIQRLMGVMERRGKKHTDRSRQIGELEELVQEAATPYEKIIVLLSLILIRFDPSATGAIMPLNVWKSAEADLRTLFVVLEENIENYMVIESAPECEDIESGPEPGPGGIRQITGSVNSLVERLDDEHTRALQVIDPHTTEYIERLRDESALYDLILHAQAYAEYNLARLGKKVFESEALCRLLLRRIDHIYYKPTSAIVITELEAWGRVPKLLSSSITPRLTQAPQNLKDYTLTVMNDLCKPLYNQPQAEFRSRAMLSLIYHYALNDDYYQARDLMLMSHLQSTIHTADPILQIMFNRALVQVGLCAFRCGLIQEALQSLQEICSSSKLKELLGQGVAKFTVVTGAERHQLLPFHMHINLELIECVYLTSSLLIEIPYLASVRNQADAKKRVISKPFRRMLDYYDRQVFSGPLENTRDHIIQAARALQQADWKSATSLLRTINIWSLFGNRDRILQMLEKKLQTEALRIYLLTYGRSYATLSLNVLQSLFQLKVNSIRATVTKMIINDEITATLDPTSEYVMFCKEADLSTLQVLTVALSDKLLQLADRNERLAADGHGPDQPNKMANKKMPVRTPSTRARS